MHFTSFYVLFHTISCILRHFMLYLKLFHHKNTLHEHSWAFSIEERKKGSKLQVLWQNATWSGHFDSNDKNASSSRRFVNKVQFWLRVPFLKKNSSWTWSNSYLRVVQGSVRDPNLVEESWKPFQLISKIILPF